MRAAFASGTIAFALAGCLIGAAALAQETAPTPTPAPAQTADKPAAASPKPPQSWTVNCASPGGEADVSCSLSQTLVVKDNGQRVLAAVVTKKNGKPTLNLALPHGLALQKGVEVWPDDQPRKTYPIVTADQKGSYAIVALDDAMLAALRKGTTLHVGVTPFSGEPIVLDVALTGFAAGYGKL